MLISMQLYSFSLLKKISLYIVLLLSCNVFCQAKKYSVRTIAFYNLENLFDTIDGPNNDNEWLPKGVQKWTSEKYRQKLHNMAQVLSEVGTSEENHESPAIIGCAEIENRTVLEDLIKEPQLINKNYGIIHFDSPDKRGIDVALLYRKEYFKPTSYINIPLYIYRETKNKNSNTSAETEEGESSFEKSHEKRVYTRDQLLVSGWLDDEEIHFIVNHWPSRSGGEKKTAPYREAAAKLNRKIMDSLFLINPNCKIITMGDLNDGVYNKSIKEGLGAKRKKEEVTIGGVYNPFEELFYKGNATIFYRDTGDIFDQIMVSQPLIKNKYNSYQYWKAGVFNKPYLITPTGQYKGYPLRHTENDVGYSDHFPVYIYLIKEIN